MLWQVGQFGSTTYMNMPPRAEIMATAAMIIFPIEENRSEFRELANGGHL